MYWLFGDNMKRLEIIFVFMIFAALFADAEGQNPTLTVVGEGTATVQADTTMILISVESINDNMTLAQAEVEEKMNNAIDALTTAGVKGEDILSGKSSGITSIQSSSKSCRQVNNTTVCQNITEKASSLERSTMVRLRTTDESKINAVLDAANSTNAKAYVEGFGLSDSDQAMAEARQKAVANAKENAKSMAAAAGARLVKVRDISDYAYPTIETSEPDGILERSATVDVTSYVVVTYEIAE